MDAGSRPERRLSLFASDEVAEDLDPLWPWQVVEPVGIASPVEQPGLCGDEVEPALRGAQFPASTVASLASAIRSPSSPINVLISSMIPGSFTPCSCSSSITVSP